MEVDWGKLNKDVLVKLALELNLPDILSLCRINKRFNRFVCDDDIFWQKKLKRDWDYSANVKEAKSIYERIERFINEWSNDAWNDAPMIFSELVDEKEFTTSFRNDFKDIFLEYTDKSINVDGESFQGLQEDVQDFLDRYVRTEWVLYEYDDGEYFQEKFRDITRILNIKMLS